MADRAIESGLWNKLINLGYTLRIDYPEALFRYEVWHESDPERTKAVFFSDLDKLEKWAAGLDGPDPETVN